MARRDIPVIFDSKTKAGQDELKKINDAINRDREIYESKKGDIDVLIKQEKEIQERIDFLVSKEGDIKETQKKLEKKNKDIINGLKEQQISLQADIDSTKQTLQHLELSVKQGEATFNKKYKELEKEYNKKAEEYEEKIVNLRLGVESEIKNKNFIINEIIELRGEKEKVEEVLKDLEEKEILKNKMENIIESYNKDYSDIKDKVNQVKLNLKGLVTEEKETFKSINLLKQEKEALSKEVEELRSEKNDYVQKKMLLKQEREELDSRENYIKTKYEEAGLSYSN